MRRMRAPTMPPAIAVFEVGCDKLDALVLVDTGTKVTDVPVEVTVTDVSMLPIVVGTTAVVVKMSVLELKVTPAWPALTAKVVAARSVGDMSALSGSAVTLGLVLTEDEVTTLPSDP